MRIESLRIKHFRGVADATLGLDPGLTVLVGANNAGKTTVLDALKAVLTYRRGSTAFLDTDFRAERSNADVRDAKPIELILRIAPTEPPRFEPGELGRAFTASIDDEGHEYVCLALKAVYSDELRQIETTLVRLEVDGETGDPDGLGAFPWRDLMPFSAFGADRDLQRGMGARWSDWRRILSQVRPTPEVLEKVASQFEQGSKLLVDKTEKLGKIAQALRPVGEALGMPGADVKLSATPQDPAEILQNVMVRMKLSGAPRSFSADRHGHGTQGALLFGIYQLQIDWMLEGGQPGASPVLTIEEPEAHLHPTAQRAMAAEIRSLRGQVVASSHSPEFVDQVQGSVALLRSVRGATSIAVVEAQDRWIRDHSRAIFARCILLTEGFESLMLPLFARALGIDLHKVGIEVVNAGGQDKMPNIWQAFGPQGLGLPVVCIADADDEEALTRFLKVARTSPLPASQAEIIDALRRHNYFTCEYGEYLELELARCAAPSIDETLLDEDEKTIEDWRGKRRELPLKKRWRTKLQLEKIGDLQDNTVARAYLLATEKADGPYLVARLMTQGGTDDSLIPARFRAALERARDLARGDLNPR